MFFCAGGCMAAAAASLHLWTLPEPVLRAWATHLADGYLRQRCASCQVHESTPGGCPLHPAQVGETLTVQCLPLHDPEPAQPGLEETAPAPPILGVLHLYLPAGRRLDADTRKFLNLLLHEIVLVYQGVHLRAQEEFHAAPDPSAPQRRK